MYPVMNCIFSTKCLYKNSFLSEHNIKRAIKTCNKFQLKFPTNHFTKWCQTKYRKRSWQLLIHAYFSRISWKIASKKDKQQRLSHLLYAQITSGNITNIVCPSTLFSIAKKIINLKSCTKLYRNLTKSIEGQDAGKVQENVQVPQEPWVHR